MIYEMRVAGVWGYALPDLTDYDEPRWATGLTQEQTPWGLAWVDGDPNPIKARLPLRVYVGATTPQACDARCAEVLSLLLTGSAFRDRRRSLTAYLVTQGILGEPEQKNYRGHTVRLITATLALASPYWVTSDTAVGGWTPTGPGTGTGTGSPTPTPPDTGYY